MPSPMLRPSGFTFTSFGSYNKRVSGFGYRLRPNPLLRSNFRYPEHGKLKNTINMEERAMYNKKTIKNTEEFL